jgi:hypothetical protein
MKMENTQTKTHEPIKTEVQDNLKQLNQKSSIQAEKIKDKQPQKLALRFSPTAWAKLLYFRDKSDNEISGFGITQPQDLLCVKEFVTVKQQVTAVSIKLDDEAVADFFDQQVDLGRKPEQFARVWLHTHPGNSPGPSITDEETFTRVFGNCQWAVMFILAQGNRTYAKLSFNVGPGGQVLIPVEIDYSCNFGPANRQFWEAEYQANIKAIEWLTNFSSGANSLTNRNVDSPALPYDFLNEFEKLDPVQRQLILDELAERPELWDQESEAMFI